MRLTADLITNSLTYLNPLKERELDLRGHRIPAIENLGVAGPLDCIDFTDNEIHALGNFPLSPRISTLLLARNRIATIQPNVPNAIPNLKNLVLASNSIAELSDLDILSQFRRLEHVVLVDNPVAKKENYRYWVIWRRPTVRFLDYVKVKDSERKQAKELFGTWEEPTELAKKIMGQVSRTFDVGAKANGDSGEKDSKISRLQLTDQEKKKLAALVSQAGSMEEVVKLEKDFMEGRIPAGVIADGEDAMEE